MRRFLSLSTLARRYVFVALCPPPAIIAEGSRLAADIADLDRLLLRLLNQVINCPTMAVGVEPQTAKLLLYLVDLKRWVFGRVKRRFPFTCVGFPGEDNRFDLLIQSPHQIEPTITARKPQAMITPSEELGERIAFKTSTYEPYREPGTLRYISDGGPCVPETRCQKTMLGQS